MVKEFKEFIMRGNVMDLAIAVIIGGAFGNIVNSLVDDVIMPALGLLLGGVSFNHLNFTFGEAVIAYGAFLQNVLDFLIIAFSIFMFIRLANNLRKKAPEEPEAEPEPTKEEILLTEIRDLLKDKK